MGKLNNGGGIQNLVCDFKASEGDASFGQQGRQFFGFDSSEPEENEHCWEESDKKER